MRKIIIEIFKDEKSNMEEARFIIFESIEDMGIHENIPCWQVRDIIVRNSEVSGFSQWVSKRILAAQEEDEVESITVCGVADQRIEMPVPHDESSAFDIATAITTLVGVWRDRMKHEAEIAAKAPPKQLYDVALYEQRRIAMHVEATSEEEAEELARQEWGEISALTEIQDTDIARCVTIEDTQIKSVIVEEAD